MRSVAPVYNQSLSCLAGEDCTLAINGFGLRRKDQLLILPAPEDRDSAVCPPTTRLLRGAIRLVPTDQLNSTALTVFKVGSRLDPGSYYMCYSAFLAAGTEDPDPRDFYHHVGFLEIGDYSVNCDFENGLCGFTNYVDDASDEVFKSGSGNPHKDDYVVAPGVGPDGDATEGLEGQGHYMYLDSPRFMPGATATLRSVPLFAPKGKQCVQFQYNMFGDDVNALRAYAAPHKKNQEVTGDWGNPSWLLVGNQGPGWKKGGFEVTHDGDAPLELVFEAVAGNSELSDIGIDDISMKPGACPQDLLIPDTPQSGSDLVCGEVRLVSGQWALDKSWYVEGAVSCAGRGYSVDQMNGTWVPCCLPHYGNYTVVLEDSFGDGWDGSYVEFRFFDQVLKLGDDFREDEGKEKSYSLIVGLMQVVAARGTESKIELDVEVRQEQSSVWCLALSQGADAPTGATVKEDGVSAGGPLKVGETRTITIDEGLEANKNYDVYCYAETSGSTGGVPVLQQAGSDRVSALQDSASETPSEMDDNQVRSSRTRVTTDSTAPKLTVEKVTPKPTTAEVTVKANEAATVWCMALPEGRTGLPPLDTFKERGSRKEASKDKNTTVVVRELYPDSPYKVYCYAEDKAAPKGNRMTEDAVKETEEEFTTESKIPELKIVSTRAVADAIYITTELDTPGQTWCAARDSQYTQRPSKDQVNRLGASAKFSRPGQKQDLIIAGVESNVNYDIYCYAASQSGSAEMDEEQMWSTKFQVQSFGAFCDMPTTPRVREEGTATPFDPLTATEESVVKSFMEGRRDLGLEGVYRVSLFPVKADILRYLDDGGPMPKRYARVRAARCSGGRGSYLQYKVGPLDSYDMEYEQLGEPVSVECAGWTPTGPFGRRLSTQHDIHRILQDSTGYPYGDDCPNQHDCLQLGPLMIDEDKNETWVGVKTPEGDQVPFFFKVRANTHPEEPYNINFLLDLHNHAVEGIFYNGHHFDSTSDFEAAFTRNEVRKLTPEGIKDQIRARKLNERRRRLQPTGGRSGRGGLEYRLAPEHAEPQGKRFTIKENPDGTSYTIGEYAGWEMTINNDRDKSLQIWNLMFLGTRVAFHMGMEEAMAHYTVQERNWYFIDSWYGGLGRAARKLTLGIECPRTAVLLFRDESTCVFEQDFGRPLRSHWKSNRLDDGAPLHGLVIRQIITVSNYDYIADYNFFTSGNFEVTVSFTGELYQGVEVPYFSARQEDYGTQVTESGRFGALHSHWASWRVDFEVYGRGDDNSVYFTEVIADGYRSGAHKTRTIWAENEIGAAWLVNGTRALTYHVVTESAATFGEHYKGYYIRPIRNEAIPWPESEFYGGPAAWTKYKVASTVYKDSEYDASLPRDNKYARRPAVSLDRYIEDSEPARRKDLVTWISSGLWHIPQIEDWPLTVAQGNTLGFLVKPFNMFEQDPSMDLHNAVGGDITDPGTCALVRVVE